ncbi:helix-turn-helix domain-containing protein [Streptomyces sp. HUAS TT20]|uniref:helix-turn-helix domain-containing protein n=1 Tax=Streptomyces sp. HUAS TT20 TaxID=3447509 RepID=UPI0021D8B46A|nr:helix-turn-helix domain-containing protein [Streptomyces sp. HUAS 15-9]UXY32091.1 helix-turn-helix domain-containing protein [Streptomyces sp. HUAS 15-9]
MNTGEHIMTSGAEHVHDDERSDRSTAMTELRNRLSDALARARLNKSQLAVQTGLGRTTVSEAFRPNGPVPSVETVAALARVLHLPQEELLGLRRAAAGPVAQDGLGPGKPIGEWEPHDLEVHPAGPAPARHGLGASRQRVLPGYVRRAHDGMLAQAVQDAQGGHSQMVVLVGTSSTGKTRACWEAVQPLAELKWRLWHPFDPTRAEAALDDLERVRPRTVVWLNEAQHYLGDAQVGERIAAAVHALLTDPGRAPVLVLGTLWPEYDRQYTALPSPTEPDPHSRVRELLAGRTLNVPSGFDAEALRAASALAKDGDRLLADALTRACAHGQVTQDLAGAPELLHRYECGTPASRALLQAAMDARRLGVGLHLPHTFLTDAATDYLSNTDHEDLIADWAEAAFAELARPVHGKQAPLRRTTDRPTRRPPGAAPPATAPGPAAGPAFRLADYLEEHGRNTRRRLCPPASFWHAAHTHLTRPDDLDNLAQAADDRHRLQWAHHLRHRAADAGNPGALNRLAEMREMAGDGEGAEALYREAADAGDSDALNRLAGMREMAGDREGAEALARLAADAGDIHALFYLAEMREMAGDGEGAEAMARQAADAGLTGALMYLAEMREAAGDGEGAEALYRQAADTGLTEALNRLAEMRERAGDRQGAEGMARQASDAGLTGALIYLAEMRERAGDREGAEAMAHQAADAGNPDALAFLAYMRENAGDGDGAEALARQAADAGLIYALITLAAGRKEAGDGQGAEALYRAAADAGDGDALISLAEIREMAGDAQGAEALYDQAADAGDTWALNRLAGVRERAGDREGAEALARQAADAGDAYALISLAEMREMAGDGEGAEALYREAADVGLTPTGPGTGFPAEERWPYGLDPDGTPTSPWQ